MFHDVAIQIKWTGGSVYTLNEYVNNEIMQIFRVSFVLRHQWLLFVFIYLFFLIRIPTALVNSYKYYCV